MSSGPANSPFRLDGKVAIVTGSTRGIGLASARLMAQAGAKLVISSRKAERCAAVCDEFRAQGFDAIAVVCHVARDEDRVQLVEQTLARWGRIDILVANAAINPSFDSLQDLPPAVWQKVLDTNLTAVWHLSRLVLPTMAAQGSGAMVMLSSTAGTLGVPNSGIYAVSKAAGNHLARQLAVEWGAQGVRINVVAPGTTRTDMIRSLMAVPGAEQQAIASTALRRLGEPDDVAAAVLFLASDAARHITGQILVVDGGQSLS
ncbi:MAG: dehydrogenase [Hydrocarboniphaga sp.]|uniref:SDR family NAD(P)-dependent oxidoreductase n=1 Tax=Hydrocarboniphaga sp. TaxID=2033016 RepID=UPI00261F5B3C|nr:SDR family oxidoreductase [Hydrocarboniphaga sp.]MDB5968403.1 dehydrogenase [Hydrocarboniphaga sp.]